MTKKEEDQATDVAKLSREQLKSLIGKHVMNSLGQPSDLHRVQVRPLWENRYRVNVFIGDDAGSARLTHSFFLVADEGGNIVSSTPKITPQHILNG